MSIEDSEILEGDLPRNKRKKILKWAEENQTELMEIWLEMQQEDEN